MMIYSYDVQQLPVKTDANEMFIKYLELCVCNMVSSIRSECNIEKEKKNPAKMMYDIFN